MKKQEIALKISSLTIGLFFILSTQSFAEVIKNFNSEIIVNLDSSVSVVETITYNSEGLVKHGIYRDITPGSSEGKSMDIKNISVVDLTGSPYQWQLQANNGDVRLKIGDPNVTFEGVKTYVITYTATNAVAHLQNGMDEIYWNVTGNNWPFAVEHSEAHVVLPSGVEATKFACYRGVSGATDRCDIAQDVIGHFINPTVLASGEGMTVAVGFPAGFVHDRIPTTKEKILVLLAKFWPILLPLLTFIVMYSKWYKKGRDAKGSGIIVPEYDAPENMSPLVAAMIVNQNLHPRDIVAEVIYLATLGYISITKIEEKTFLSKKIDYTLRLEKLPESSLVDFDVVLLNEIFSKENTKQVINVSDMVQQMKLIGMMPSAEYIPLELGKAVKLSEINGLMGAMLIVAPGVKKNVVDQGYYTSDFIEKINFIKMIVGLLPYIALFLVVRLFSQSLFLSGGPVTVLMFIGGIIVSAIIVSGFNSIMPAKTIKGVKSKESLLGLKHYIELAEKDRIEFHNAPEKNPKLFEHLLPYAIIFEQEKKWARAFESIALDSPSWYRGDIGTFNAVVFASSLTSDFSQSLGSVAGFSGGGSGGGGFSGGGGGGGGGGSW